MKTSQGTNQGCANHPIVWVVGFVAALIAIFTFITGITSLQPNRDLSSQQAPPVVAAEAPQNLPVVITSPPQSTSAPIIVTSPPQEVVKIVEVTSTPDAAQLPTKDAKQVQSQPQTKNQVDCKSIQGAFSDVLSQVQTKIGCAVSDEISGQIVVEEFEKGKMIWRQPLDFGDSSNGYALVLTYSNLWRRYSHTPYRGDGGVSCDEAKSLGKPTGGFGMMWCNIAEIRLSLGNAVSGEKNFVNGTAMQEFQKGFMVLVEGNRYIFYADGTWETR